MVNLLPTDILFIETERAYSRIVTQEKAYLFFTSPRSLEEKIPSEFHMRIHRSFVVNQTHIEAVKENFVHIHQKYIPVSRSYWDAFMRRVQII